MSFEKRIYCEFDASKEGVKANLKVVFDAAMQHFDANRLGNGSFDFQFEVYKDFQKKFNYVALSFSVFNGVLFTRYETQDRLDQSDYASLEFKSAEVVNHPAQQISRQ